MQMERKKSLGEENEEKDTKTIKIDGFISTAHTIVG